MRARYPQRLVEVFVICESGDKGTIAKAQEKIAALRAEGINNVRLLVFDDLPINKPHGLKVGLRASKNDVVTIFDAEDEIHSDVFNVVNTVMLNEGARVVQCGVQLMNFNSSWYATLNVLEYFFWFKSRLHYHAKMGMIPFIPCILATRGYMEQAWSVIREARLSPYTYFYDHAPGGWILIAGWSLLLPGQFGAFGMSINSGRLLMLLLHLASVVLLYRVARKLTGSHIAAVATTSLFTLSPLGLYYQRMVLLDNILVFWIMLALYLVVFHGHRLITLIASGLAFGMAVLTKENAAFFAPVLGYMIYCEVKQSYDYRFAMVGWLFSAVAMTSLCPLYALLKNELFPSGSLLSTTPAEHVSLITTLFWQLGRSGGNVVDPNSQFWVFLQSRWWTKDSIILVLGTAASGWNIMLGIMDRERYRNNLIAGLFAAAFGFYLVKGSAILEFYVVPMLPFLVLNAGMVMDKLLRHVFGRGATTAFLIVFVALSMLLIYRAQCHSRSRRTGIIDGRRTLMTALLAVAALTLVGAMVGTFLAFMPVSIGAGSPGASVETAPPVESTDTAAPPAAAMDSRLVAVRCGEISTGVVLVGWQLEGSGSEPGSFAGTQSRGL